MSNLKTGMKWRYIAFILILLAMFAYLLSGLVNLQLRQSDYYAEKADNNRTKTITLRGKRGNIIDADSVVLAEDELVYNVTFYKDASQNTKSDYKVYTPAIVDTLDIIERHGGELAFNYVIERDPETQEWQFNFGSGVSDSVRKSGKPSRRRRARNTLSPSSWTKPQPSR